MNTSADPPSSTWLAWVIVPALVVDFLLDVTGPRWGHAAGNVLVLTLTCFGVALNVFERKRLRERWLWWTVGLHGVWMYFLWPSLSPNRFGSHHGMDDLMGLFLIGTAEGAAIASALEILGKRITGRSDVL